MVTMNTERRVFTYPEAKAKYDGHWLLFDKREFPPADDMGYVIAYGDGTAEDREALMRICIDKYDGKILLMKGWAQKDGYVLNSGIVEAV
ncbi:MAG: hypothetical protein FWD14_06375 [Treponema sp.]|nr:hypothetical protein [Treponema sp.]